MATGEKANPGLCPDLGPQKNSFSDLFHQPMNHLEMSEKYRSAQMGVGMLL